MKSRKVTPYSCEENSGLMHRTRDERKWVISLKDAKLSHDGVEGNKNARVVGRTLLFQSQSKKEGRDVFNCPAHPSFFLPFPPSRLARVLHAVSERLKAVNEEEIFVPVLSPTGGWLLGWLRG